jgi:beta-glucosidase
VQTVYNYKHSQYSRQFATSVSGALWPFGYGLSYSDFAYSDASLSKTEIGTGESLKASVTVTNNGPYDGDEVVQLYIRDEYGSVTRPVKELKAFSRISLKNGESRTVEFDITPEMLQCWGAGEKWAVEPGDFTVLVGSSSADADLIPLALKVK